MKQRSLLACMMLLIFCSGAHGESWDFSFTTVSAVANADGSELITTVLYEYPHGSPFAVEYHVTASGISTPGGGFIAPVSNFPVHGAPAIGGSWGPGPFPGSGGGGIPGDLIIQGGSESSLNSQCHQSRSEFASKDDNHELNAGPLIPIIAGGACVANHIAQIRVLKRVCGDDGVDEMGVNACGTGGFVRCNEPPAPPPPQPDPDALFWFNSIQMTWSPPFDWGWINSGPFVITDGY